VTRTHWRCLQTWLHHEIARERREIANPYNGVTYAKAKARAVVLDQVLLRMRHEVRVHRGYDESQRRAIAARAGWAKRRARQVVRHDS
jgi:hypothetical protein